MKDLHFISKNFIDWDIPKDQRYLLKYFKTDIQVAFLKYYLCFGTIKNFVDHTGIYSTARNLKKLRSRYNRLISAHKDAKSKFTEESMELLQKIESGKYNLN